MTIDLRKMRQVLEVARAESITTAAATLAISQPALTRRISEVEDELGVQLFHRLPRGVRLTEVGREFVNHARKLLEDADLLMQKMGDHRGLDVGRLRVGEGNATYQRFLSPALADFVSVYPNLQLEVVAGSVESLAPKVISGELDLLLGSAGPMTRWPDLLATSVADLYCAFMVRRGHPFLKLSNPTELDLLRYPIVVPQTVEAIYTDLSLIYRRNDLPPMRPQYTTDDFELVKAIVKSTDTFSPVLGKRPGFSRLGKEFCLLEDVIAMPVQQIGVARSRAQVPSPAAIELTRIVTEYFAPKEKWPKEK